MGMAVKVRMLMAVRKMKLKELAAKLDPPVTPQTTSGKLHRDNLTEKDLIAIAKACNAEFEGVFTLNDSGKTI